MATIRLTPSAYALSNNSYATVSDAANMYHNVDNDTYATVQHTRAATMVVYLYIRGFDFSQVPEGVTVTGWTLKFKVRESGASTSTTYLPRAANGTAIYSSLTASGVPGTTVKTITFTGELAWETVKAAGAGFGIRVAMRRNSTGTAAYFYIYGAEIEVEYEEPATGGLYVKQNGVWRRVTQAWRKENGVWTACGADDLGLTTETRLVQV